MFSLFAVVYAACPWDNHLTTAQQLSSYRVRTRRGSSFHTTGPLTAAQAAVPGAGFVCAMCTRRFPLGYLARCPNMAPYLHTELTCWWCRTNSRPWVGWCPCPQSTIGIVDLPNAAAQASLAEIHPPMGTRATPWVEPTSHGPMTEYECVLARRFRCFGCHRVFAVTWLSNYCEGLVGYSHHNWYCAFCDAAHEGCSVHE